jgi:hypothetical protein
LRGPRKRPPRPAIDPDKVREVAQTLPVQDAPLRTALGRLGAAVKRP